MQKALTKILFAYVSYVFLLSPVAYGESLVTIGLTQLPSTLHPYADPDNDAHYASHLWGTPLVVVNDEKQWACGVCTELPNFENKMAATVAKGKYQLLKTIWRLNKNHRWSDGTPVTADDFVLAWEIIQTVRMDEPTAWLELSEIQNIEVGGNPRELVIWFGGKTPEFNRLLRFFPVPAHKEQQVWEESQKIPRNYFARTTWRYSQARSSVFNGSYVLTNRAKDHLYLKANDQKKPVAKIPKLRIVKFDGFGSLSWAVRNNIAHIVPESQLSYSELIELQKQTKTRETKGVYKFLYKDSGRLEILALNLRNPVLSDLRMRRALSYATNRKGLVDKTFTRTKTFYDDWAKAFASDSLKIGWAYDFARVKAAKLLTELGWRSPKTHKETGFRKRDETELAFEITYDESSAIRELAAEEIKRQWESIGIRVTINPESDRAYRHSVLSRASYRDACLVSVDFQPGSNPKSFIHGKSIPSYENNYSGQNIMGWHDKDANTAMDDWDNAYLDQEKYKLARDELLERIEEEVPFLPLFRRSDGAVADARLGGFTVGSFWGPSSQNAQTWVWNQKVSKATP